MRVSPLRAVDWTLAFVGLLIAALGPVIFSGYFAHTLLTQVFWYGIAAASLIFLSAYGGMVSLAQVSLYGIAGFVLGNAVTSGQVKGLHLGLNPWVGVVLALAITTVIGILLGAVSSRSAGIYFLMITLAFSVLANTFFGQVTVLSGFSGIGNIQNHTPALISNPAIHPNRLYYVALVVSVAVYAVMRYVTRTPFGLALQGIRDDPVRMSSLGFNVPLHRTLAFGFGALIASVAGILFVWWNGQIAPGSIDLSATIDLLVIAVIGSLFRLEGAWVGAFVFVIVNNYIRSVPGLGHIGIQAERYHTVIGAIFLIIVLLSPGGLLGIWGWLVNQARRIVAPPPRPASAEATAGPASEPG
jgi:branched-chain amino acid transport system permease protein